jgi:LPPG:FO 2-phospho-L-lactate transferase
MFEAHPHTNKVVALSGGVGGARMTHGMVQIMAPEQLTAVVNTGDDFVHWGLNICPDLDTVLYTLSGWGDETRGWGQADESFRALEAMGRLGEPDWFQLGDKDLATHLGRTRRMAQGATLTSVIEDLRRAMGISIPILPMCDTPRPTIIETEDHGDLPFQDWFVRLRCQPRATGFRFEGPDEPSAQVLDALDAADWILITPSNPFVSVDPILTLRGVRERLEQKPVLAVSPIVGNSAVKGPLAKMFEERDGQPPSAKSVADHYAGLVDVMLVHNGDSFPSDSLKIIETDILMKDIPDRARLAREVLDLAHELWGGRS